eukprot:CAMPEP_0174819110 /NCGR_PEP_ID=MMETSP1107-20130205/2139_1 /TAXON_ID=36770 /ORGANISM="Paraphysomonas vestita, Strain GFlagA" /LENGTH=522 /DNA_ID=CAMNT_0016031999 /DNA_START=1071 /DNA_END=2639 /DNA_ORIENTATION=+
MVDIQITIQHLPDLQPIPWPSNWKVGETEERLRKEYHFTDGVIKLNGEPLHPDETFANQMENVEGEKSFTFVNGISTLPAPVPAPASKYFSPFELMGQVNNRTDMNLFFQAPEYIISPSYINPRGVPRSSDAHVNVERKSPRATRGSSRISSVQSSNKGGMNALDLSDFDINRSESTMYLIRWKLTPELIEKKLLELFNEDSDTLETLVDAETKLLQKLRNEFGNAYHQNKRLNETAEFQPVFQLFLQGFLEAFNNRFLPPLQRTTAAANTQLLTASFPLKEPSDTGELNREESGYADIFVLRGAKDAAIEFVSNGNIETVIELKSPFKSLYHTSHRAGMDQLTGEVEGLGQSLGNPPVVIKGLITDMNTISLHLRVSHNNKIYHCLTNRIVDAKEYIKQLLFICYCSIQIDDIIDSIQSFEYLDISNEIEDNEEGNPGKDGEDKKDDHSREQKKRNRGDGSEDGNKDSDHTNKKGRSSRHNRGFIKYFDEYEEQEMIHNLLEHDARIRGFHVIRTSDLLTR